jgi:hypothetical protein
MVELSAVQAANPRRSQEETVDRAWFPPCWKGVLSSEMSPIQMEQKYILQLLTFSSLRIISLKSWLWSKGMPKRHTSSSTCLARLRAQEGCYFVEQS